MLKQKKFIGSTIFLLLFILWTLAVSVIDDKTIGPLESAVGFATINKLVHNLRGVNFTFYYITDWLGLVPLAVCFGFGVALGCLPLSLVMPASLILMSALVFLIRHFRGCQMWVFPVLFFPKSVVVNVNAYQNLILLRSILL